MYKHSDPLDYVVLFFAFLSSCRLVDLHSFTVHSPQGLGENGRPLEPARGEPVLHARSSLLHRFDCVLGIDDGVICS